MTAEPLQHAIARLKRGLDAHFKARPYSSLSSDITVQEDVNLRQAAHMILSVLESAPPAPSPDVPPKTLEHEGKTYELVRCSVLELMVGDLIAFADGERDVIDPDDSVLNIDERRAGYVEGALSGQAYIYRPVPPSPREPHTFEFKVRTTPGGLPVTSFVEHFKPGTKYTVVATEIVEEGARGE